MRRGRPLRRWKRLVSRASLRRGGPIKRRAQLRSVNRGRRVRLNLRNFGPKAEWIRSLPCAGCGMPPDQGVVQAAHVRARGMGGCNGSSADLVPLCATRGCHDLQHDVGVDGFRRARGVDLEVLAAELEEEWGRR